MTGLTLEIGNIYKRKLTGVLHLAVRQNLMVTYIERVLTEVCACEGFSVERHLPVRFLLEEWKVSIAELDRVATLYLAPFTHRNVNTRQRRTKRRGDNTEEMEIFRVIRLHQITVSRHKST